MTERQPQKLGIVGGDGQTVPTTFSALIKIPDGEVWTKEAVAGFVGQTVHTHGLEHAPSRSRITYAKVHEDGWVELTVEPMDEP